jgi:hypothetical protein
MELASSGLEEEDKLCGFQSGPAFVFYCSQFGPLFNVSVGKSGIRRRSSYAERALLGTSASVCDTPPLRIA